MPNFKPPQDPNRTKRSDLALIARSARVRGKGRIQQTMPADTKPEASIQGCAAPEEVPVGPPDTSQQSQRKL